MNLDLVEYLKTNPNIALVGATNDKTKYGNIIFHDLLRKNYKIFPINPKAQTIDGHRSYNSLVELNKEVPIGLIVFVVPPTITYQILQTALELNLKKVWIQPGAGNQEIREFLEKNNFEYLMDVCVMVMTNNKF